jgi:hypothetical protein
LLVRASLVRLPLALGATLCALSGAAWAETAPTFYKDVLPILQNRCQSCHRPGEAAPMPLLTYGQSRPWAKAIKQAVIEGKMPPWSANPKYGKFANDLSLAPGERETLLAWVDGGAPEGDRADAPAPKQWTEGWKIPKPDVVFEMPEEFEVPATGVLSYQYFTVPTNFKEDRWVEALEVRPGESSVVHHAIVTVETGEGYRGARGYLAGYAPGMLPQLWKPGQARLIPAGAFLVFQMHYTTNGKPAKDRTRIGLVFAKKPPKQQVVAMSASSYWLAIPPGDPNYRTEAATLIRRDLYLVGMRAHMHLRGKAFQFRAVYPSGESEILLDIPKYDFNWQPYYYLETPKKLPAGTRIECTAVYDNSKNNPHNPDPTVEVRWGAQTWEEMMIGWFDVAVDLRNGAPVPLSVGRVIE